MIVTMLEGINVPDGEQDVASTTEEKEKVGLEASPEFVGCVKSEVTAAV